MRRWSTLKAGLAAALISIAGHSAQADENLDLFSGFYGGLAGGYVAVDESWGTVGTGGPTSANLSLDGGAGGLTIGYNWNANGFLLGLEADGMLTAANDSNVCSGMSTAICDIDVDGVASFRGRLGWIFGEQNNLSVYATGGAAVVWYGASNPARGGQVSEETDVTYAVGGGLEAFLFDTHWLSTKLEYLFVGLDRTYVYTIGTGTGTGRLNFNGIHFVKWGWNIHF